MSRWTALLLAGSRPGGDPLARSMMLGHKALIPVGGEPMDPEQFREDFAVLLELLREGKIHPVVAERLPLSEARHAHELLESSAAQGKLVLVP